MTEEKRTILNVIQQIDEFDRKTTLEEYTDPGDSWDLLNDIRDSLNNILPQSLQVA